MSIVSPSELLYNITKNDAEVMAVALGGVVMGPAKPEAKESGVIEIYESGTDAPELYAPFLRQQMRVHAIAPEPTLSERISRTFYARLHAIDRRIVSDADGTNWLVHNVLVTSGPTLLSAEEITYQTVSIAIILVGTDPIP